MEVVINISKDYYKIIKYEVQGGNDYLPFKLIAKGTPLPEEHGRLIDADELFLDIQTDEEMRLGENLKFVKERIDKASAIIESNNSSV